MAIETEVKYSITNAGLIDAIISDPFLLSLSLSQGWKTVSMKSVYYDTGYHDLLNAGIAYRVRQEGTKWVATIKKGGDPASNIQQRQEWNIEVASIAPDIAPFLKTEIGSELSHIVGDKEMVVLFTCCFLRRYLLLLLENDTRVELAIDTGEITGGSLREPICEMELELKQGELPPLIKIARILSERYHLSPEPRSKFSRGLALIGLQAGLPGQA